MSFPNDQQKEVIDHRGRPLVVVAGPGTGKTSTIVARMEILLKENPGREISFITFTRSSRRDTGNKVSIAVGKEALEEAVHELPRICTLHTYAKAIVHKYASRLGRSPRFSILIEQQGERDLVYGELAEDLGLIIDLPTIVKEVTYFRNTGLWHSESILTEQQKRDILDRLSGLLEFYDAFELEGLVPAACEIISQETSPLPSVLLQVDEYQDLNPMDQTLVSLVSRVKSSEIIAVGDDAQSIYGFRQAYPRGISELWNSSDWDHIAFHDCHRLPGHVVRASQALISGRGYLGDQITVPELDANRINVLQCTTSDIQIGMVAKLIHNIPKTERRRNGEPLTLGDFMILCPTSGFVSTVAKKLAEEYNIETKVQEKIAIPADHWRLLLVLRMIENDNLALRQWLEIAGIPRGEVLAWRVRAEKARKTLFPYCSEIIHPVVADILDRLRSLSERRSDLDLFRKELLDFPNLVVEDSLFPDVGITINESTHAPNSISSVIRTIHERFGILDVDAGIPEEDKVLVTTMYSAKGLEAEFVFLMWMNSTFMPSANRDEEEERRVLYVAMTRAKQDLIILFHEKFQNGRRLGSEALSPFLLQIKKHLKIIRIAKSDLG